MLSDIGTHALPPVWHEIEARSVALGFDMPSDARTGALLKALAASKPGGRLLELGTGTGLATACLLAGMDDASRLVSIDVDARCQAVAREVLGSDPRVSFRHGINDLCFDAYRCEFCGTGSANTRFLPVSHIAASQR